MTMAIDQAGCNVHALAVELEAIGSPFGFDVVADGLDFSICNQQLRVGQHTFFTAGPNRCVANQDGCRPSQDSAPFQRRTRHSRLLQLADLLFLFVLLSLLLLIWSRVLLLSLYVIRLPRRLFFRRFFKLSRLTLLW